MMFVNGYDLQNIKGWYGKTMKNWQVVEDMMTPSPNHRSIQLISAVDPKVFLDVDIDGELAAFQLGQAFVEAWREAMSGKIQLANCISSRGPSILVCKVYNDVHMWYIIYHNMCTYHYIPNTTCSDVIMDQRMPQKYTKVRCREQHPSFCFAFLGLRHHWQLPPGQWHQVLPEF